MPNRELSHQQEYEIPTWTEQPHVPSSDIDLIRAGLDKVLESNGHGRILSPERPISPEAQISQRIKSEDDQVRALRALELQEA